MIWLGSHRLLEDRGQETPEMHEQLEEHGARWLERRRARQE